jgi:archaeosine-15-forming tRNA-guanine transglycosylase
MLSSIEMRAFKTGVAVKVRHGVNKVKYIKVLV